jgi:hypothetical protein
VVVQGDQREPVSAWHPCFRGKIQGILEKSPAICGTWTKITAQNQPLGDEFPKDHNRELKSADQGKFSREQGS